MLNLKTMPLLTLPLVLLLNGCATTNSHAKTDTAVSVESYCLIAHPICISSKDGITDKTADQIKAHDAYGMKHCKWRCQ